MVLRFLLSKTKINMKFMLHCWWNLRVLVFWTAVQHPRLVALRALKLCSPRVMNMIFVFQRLIPFGVRSFNFGDGASSKASSLARLRVRNDALGDFWVPVHLFVDQPKPTELMLGMDLHKEQRCVIDYGKDFG